MITPKKTPSAPPPLHTLVVFTLVVVIISLNLPTLASVDQIATSKNFQASPLLRSYQSHSATSNINQPLGLVRLLIAFTIAYVTISTIRLDAWVETPFYLPGSKLKPAALSHQDTHILRFDSPTFMKKFTQWSWNMLGLSFFFSGIISFLPQSYHHPYLLRAALVTFEIAAPSAILVSTVVTYILWPELHKKRGPSGTERFKVWNVLLQHNLNSIFVILEIAIIGNIPILLSHVVFPPIFGIFYVLFSWFMPNRWTVAKKNSVQRNTNKNTQQSMQTTNTKAEKKERNDEIVNTGPQYVYFFLDTTLPGYQTTFFMLFLLCILIFFHAILVFSKNLFLEDLVEIGNATNVFCRLAYFCCFSFLVCRFKD